MATPDRASHTAECRASGQWGCTGCSYVDIPWWALLVVVAAYTGLIFWLTRDGATW